MCHMEEGMKISEIFTSVNGEVTGWGQGSLTTFVRLHGCNLKCPYCDARYANDGPMELMTVEQVLDQHGVRLGQELFLHLAHPCDTVSFSL